MTKDQARKRLNLLMEQVDDALCDVLEYRDESDVENSDLWDLEQASYLFDDACKKAILSLKDK